MNLCGIGNFAEPELIKLEVKSNRFKAASSGRRSSTSTSRREIETDRRKSSQGRSTSRRSEPSPTFLNPISKDDIKGAKPHPVRSLERGFNLKLIADKKVKRIRLDSDPEKPHLRIRPQADKEGSENDRSRSNVAEVKLRLQDIVRLEVGRDKKKSSLLDDKPVKSFSLILKTRSKQLKTFQFEAESLKERDIIVSAIKILLQESSRKRGSDSYQPKKEISNSTRSERTTGPSMRDLYLENKADRRNDSSGRRGSSDDSSRDSGSGRDSSYSSGKYSRETSKTSDGSSVVQKSDYKGFGCHAFACHSQALGAVEDTEFTSKFANQPNGAWCTDDICTGGITDFTKSVKDFGVPDMTAGISLLSVKDIWKASDEKATKIVIKKQRLQNRARHASAKARRLNRLRLQMTFEGADNPNNIPHLKTIKSCDEYGMSKEPAIFSSFESKKNLKGEEELYYDSDPEDARERTFRRLGPRGTLAEKQNKTQDDSAIEEERVGTSMMPLYNRKLKKVDEGIILDIIENLKNQKLNFMWHPTQSEENKNQAPVCVKVWIESGVYLMDGTFLLPKLTWVPIHEANIDSFVMNAAVENPKCLDLLDVCRVRECTAIDRRRHPYANVDRSFLIQTQNETTLFETRSKQERAHIVNGMKLVIARLASLLMLRDVRAVDEFFGGNSVPGEAPWWAKGDKEEDESSPPGLPTAI